MQAAADKLWPTEGYLAVSALIVAANFDGEMLSHNPANPAGAAVLLLPIA